MAFNDLIDVGKQTLGGTLSKAGGFLADEIGGQLEKVTMTPYVSKKTEVVRASGIDEVELLFNPAKIKWSNKLQWTDQTDSGNESTAKTFGGGSGWRVSISNVWFDTFEMRQSVRDVFIEKLEALVQRAQDDDHAPPYVLLTWGKFMAKSNERSLPLFVVESLDVEYTMFLPDATPVRANVSLSLVEATPPGWRKPTNKSPDHAKLITLRRGDSLHAIAQREYDDPGEWRRIADANSIDDPMQLTPGMKLLIPPILK